MQNDVALVGRSLIDGPSILVGNAKKSRRSNCCRLSFHANSTHPVPFAEAGADPIQRPSLLNHSTNLLPSRRLGKSATEYSRTFNTFIAWRWFATLDRVTGNEEKGTVAFFESVPAFCLRA